MKTINLKEAKASFSALVDDAEHGHPSIVTKHGKPAAMIVPVEAGQKIFPVSKTSFVDLLLSFPGGDIEFERNMSSSREIDL